MSRDKRGYYPIEGVGEFVSVTTVLNVLEKYNLHPWIAGKAVRRFYELLCDEELKAIKGRDEAQEKLIDIEPIIERAVSFPDESREESADFGTRFHSAMDMYHKTGAWPIDPEIVPYFEKAREWEESVELEVIESEQTVYSRTYRYAGTLDLYCKVRFDKDQDKRVGIIDFKTFGDEKGNGMSVYPSWKQQLGAYTHALEEMKKLYKKRLDFGMIAGINKTAVSVEPKLYWRGELIQPAEEFFALCNYWNITKKGC
jgi:hypothetical protein